MRWLWVGVLGMLLAGCTSAWDQHKQLVEVRTVNGDYAGAAMAQKWLVDNSYRDAPSTERGTQWDGVRLLELADLQARSKQTVAAIETYREVLRVDPTQIEAVLVGIGMLDLPEDRRNALLDEFVQNVVVIDQRVLVGLSAPAAACWSYVAHQIRIHRRDRSMGAEGFEHNLNYDARPWVYDVSRQAWRPDGEWVLDAGSEMQRVNGPPNPRYQAILDADGGFYVDGAVPGCHASHWRGPYDQQRRTIFVAASLPTR